MIYKTSRDPVFIKKINVKIWSVRDEIEEVIKHRLNQLSSDDTIKNLPREELKNVLKFDEIVKEYNGKLEHSEEINAIEQVSAAQGVGEIDPLEAEMLRATENEGVPPQAEAQDAAAADPAEEVKPTEEANPANPLEAQNTPEGTPESATDASSKAENETTTSVTEVTLKPGIQKEGQLIHIIQRHPKVDEKNLALGRLILSEISNDQMYLFVDKKFIEGQNIRIELMIPRHFIISAQVKFCRKFSIKSKVIRETRLVYRLVAQFTFERPGERTLLRQFLKSISPDLASIKKSQPKAAPAAGVDELDDLDL